MFFCPSVRYEGREYHVLLSFCQICSNAPLENTLQRTENALKSCNHLIHNALTPFLLMYDVYERKFTYTSATNCPTPTYHENVG